MGHGARHEQRAILEVVRRRQAQRLATTASTGTRPPIPDKTAIIWVPELEDDETVHISYGELLRRVNEFAALLQGLRRPEGRRPGHAAHADGPRAAVTMLACARLGVIHSAGIRRILAAMPAARASPTPAAVSSSPWTAITGPASMTDHKVKADEAIAEAARQGQEVDKVLVWRRHAGEYASQPRRWSTAGTSSSTRSSASTRARRSTPVSHACRGAAVPDVHQRHHRPAEGRAAQHRRLHVLRGRDLEVLPGHPPRRRVLVPGRHRLDHRPLLHRLRAAGARHDHGDLRGRAELSRRRAAVADRREARRQHLPHLADRRSGCCARSARTSRPSTTTTSST